MLVNVHGKKVVSEVLVTIINALFAERRRWSECGQDPNNPVAKIAAIEIASIDKALDALGVEVP